MLETFGAKICFAYRLISLPWKFINARNAENLKEYQLVQNAFVDSSSYFVGGNPKVLFLCYCFMENS